MTPLMITLSAAFLQAGLSAPATREVLFRNTDFEYLPSLELAFDCHLFCKSRYGNVIYRKFLKLNLILSRDGVRATAEKMHSVY